MTSRRTSRACSTATTPGFRAVFRSVTSACTYWPPPIHPRTRCTATRCFPSWSPNAWPNSNLTSSTSPTDRVTPALAGGTVEFMTVIGNVVPITMISRLIGFHDSDLDQLLRAAFDSTAMLGSTLTLDDCSNSSRAPARSRRGSTVKLAAAERSRSDDLLGAVARGVEGGVFSAFEANGILHTLLSAGGESTTSLLGNAVRILAEQPELQQHLRQNPEQIPTFMEEALRLEPPFRYHMRSVPKDTTLGGVDIPAGATVLLLWGAANRDPAEFERPDEVDLERQAPRHHVSFGRGIHHCVGAPLARIEARNVLTVLLERTKNIALDPQHAPRWVNSLMVRRHEQLPVRLIGR